MQYFILMPGDTEHDVLNEANLLGESSFGNFWAGSGLTTLMKLVDSHPEVLPMITIRSDTSQRSYTIEQFLTEISKLKVRSR
jgi:hypothetical protein